MASYVLTRDLPDTDYAAAVDRLQHWIGDELEEESRGE